MKGRQCLNDREMGKPSDIVELEFVARLEDTTEGSNFPDFQTVRFLNSTLAVGAGINVRENGTFGGRIPSFSNLMS